MRGSVAKRLRREAAALATAQAKPQIYIYTETSLAVLTHDGPVWNRTYRVHPDTPRGHYLRLKRLYKKAQRA